MIDSLEPFVLLADPANYLACSWDLNVDATARVHWVDFFCRHVETILKLGVEAATARGEALAAATRRAASCQAEFVQRFQTYASNPDVAWGA